MPKKLTQEQALTRCIEAHNGFYSYPNMIYTKAKEKIEIECPVHGSFWQLYHGHISGLGCRKCSSKHQYTTEEWVSLYKERFGGRYCLDKVIYKDSKTHIIMGCPVHGDFSTSPHTLLQGTGCNKCGNVSIGKSLAHTKVVFTGRANKVHPEGYYCYEKFTYTNALTSGIIKCLRCATEFTQRPSDHLLGKGCPKCAKYGFDPNSPSILYYLKINKPGSPIVFKIGVTNRSVKERFRKDYIKFITILHEEYFSIGKDCLKEEKRILKEFKEYKYTGPNVLSTGFTEMFITDIRNIYKDT